MRLVLMAIAAGGMMTMPTAADEPALRQAVLLYASFDREVRADHGGGGLTFDTRYGPPGVPEKYVFKKGFDAKVFRIAPDKGMHGGALEALGVLPDNGRIFLPARGNLAYRPGGWGGAVSFWINTDPNRALKTTFCDPVQITQKGANNGGIWCDFTAAKPRRDLRMGVFPAVDSGQKPIAEDAPDAPLVRLPGVAFKAGEWHHLVLSWSNLDSGRADAEAILYVDGVRIGAIARRPLAMQWDLDKAGIYVAVNYIGLLDEFATFRRPLTGAEVELLHRQPGLLAKDGD
jgi:hypothetical protein